MVQAHLSLDLDIRDPDFHRIALARALQAQREMHELVLITKETIATTRALMARADRMIASI